MVSCRDASDNVMYDAIKVTGSVSDISKRIASDLAAQGEYEPSGEPKRKPATLSGRPATEEVQSLVFVGNDLQRYLRAFVSGDGFYVASVIGPGVKAGDADRWLDAVKFDDLK